MVLLSLLVADVALGGPPLDLDGSTWTFASTSVRSKARAQGIGKVKGSSTENLVVRLLAGNAWEADFDGTPFVSGTYTRKHETAKKLTLMVDGASAIALASLFEGEVQDAAALEGVGITLSLTLDQAKLTMSIKPKAKVGTAKAKLKAKFKFSGLASAPGLGVSNAASSVASKLKGVSATIPLADITGAVAR